MLFFKTTISSDILLTRRSNIGVYEGINSVSFVIVKEGVPSDDVLEVLAVRITDVWRRLGRRLHFYEVQLTAFHKENEEYSEKALHMLHAWKQRDGSAATYSVLYHALCHYLVNLRDVAEKVCCGNDDGKLYV